MTIRLLHPGDEAYLESFLLPKIESSMFLLGNMRTAGLLDNGRYLQGVYVAAWQENKIIGVVAHYWNGNLVLQAPLDWLESLWRTAVAASKRPLMGIAGPKPQVQLVKNKLQIPQEAIKLEEPEKLYRLHLANLIVLPKLQSGAWVGRRSKPSDLALMTQWRTGYALETMGEQDSPALRQRLQEGVEKYQKLGRTWILEDGGQPVATSSFNTATTEAVQVGGVWTPPELRRQGYGRGVVAASLLDAQQEGAEIAVLFTGEENIPAQKAYEALGFEHLGDYCLLNLHSPME